jgi:hypothetical protein
LPLGSRLVGAVDSSQGGEVCELTDCFKTFVSERKNYVPKGMMLLTAWSYFTFISIVSFNSKQSNNPTCFRRETVWNMELTGSSA